MPQFKVAIDALILNDLHNRVFKALKDEFDGKVAVSVRGDAVEFTVTAPDPKPTIPELIDRWRQGGFKADDQRELWKAIRLLDADASGRSSYLDATVRAKYVAMDHTCVGLAQYPILVY